MFPLGHAKLLPKVIMDLFSFFAYSIIKINGCYAFQLMQTHDSCYFLQIKKIAQLMFDIRACLFFVLLIWQEQGIGGEMTLQDHAT